MKQQKQLKATKKEKTQQVNKGRIITNVKSKKVNRHRKSKKPKEK